MAGDAALFFLFSEPCVLGGSDMGSIHSPQSVLPEIWIYREVGFDYLQYLGTRK